MVAGPVGFGATLFGILVGWSLERDEGAYLPLLPIAFQGLGDGVINFYLQWVGSSHRVGCVVCIVCVLLVLFVFTGFTF